MWWIRDVTRTALAGTGRDDARLAAARRNEPAVSEWLNDHLRHERSVLDWDDSDAPGPVLIAPECFTPEQPEELRAVTAMLVAHPHLRHHREAITAHRASAKPG